MVVSQWGGNILANFLCSFIHTGTMSEACHVMLILSACSVCPLQSCVLEDGYSGLPDVWSHTLRFGEQLVDAEKRLRNISSEIRHLGFFEKAPDAFRLLRGAAYSLDPANLATLLARGYTSMPQKLVCSTFVAKFLVAIGCMRNDAVAYNALPKDFENFTCVPDQTSE